MDKDSKFTRDDEGYIAVRVVNGTEALPAVDKDYLFARDENGNIAMRVVGADGSGGGSVNYNRVVEKATVIPDASTQEVGKVYMYMGKTNSTYTHGYIYENVAEQTASDVTFSGNIISSWAVADFVNYLQEGGSAYNEVTNGTLTYSGDGDLWVLVGLDSNGNEVLRFQEYTEDLEDFGCVFASQTHQDGDSCTFTLTTTVSGKKWKRMDVQPGGGSVSGDYVPQYDTMPSAGASNLGDVVQYSGATNETYTNGYFYKNVPQVTDSSATISQTSGVIPPTATFTIMSGNASISASPEDVESFYLKYWSPAVSDTISIAYNHDTARINVSSAYYGIGYWTTQEEMEAEGFVFSELFGAGCQVNCAFVPTQGLKNLSVDVETFETAEQPTGNETVNFVANVQSDELEFVSVPEGTSFVATNPNLFAQWLTNQGASLDSWTNALFHWNGENWFIFDKNFGNSLGGMSAEQWRDWGVEITGVPTATSQDAEYVLTIGGQVTWSKNGTTVDIAEYGISYSGTPNENDTLTVAYLAPSVIGYGWEQLNVQPELKEGIDWKVKLDLPAEYTGDLWNAFPVYTIAGGLPDGKYKFYFSTKQTSDFAQSNGLYAEAVFTVLFNIQNTTMEYQGIMGYVFDGEYIPSPSFARALDQIDVYTFIGKKGNDIVIATTNEPFSTGVLGSSGVARLVPECFKISAITNVETGEEYIPTGYVPLDGQIPADFYAYSGRLTMARLGNPPYIPSKTIFSTLSYSEINNNVGFRIETGQANKIYIRCSSEDDVFYAYVYRTPNEYEQEILQATGKFENWKFRFSTGVNSVINIDFGTPNFTSNVSLAMGAFGSEPSSVFYTSYVVNQADFLPLVCPYVGIGKSCRMETPTANQLGGVVQYVGETDANYTKGSNYTAKGTVVIVPESAVAANIDPNIATISIDASALITAMSAYTGWSESNIRADLNNGHSWQIGYDFDNNQIISLNWAAWGGFDASVWSAFTVTPDSGQSGVQYINFVTQYTQESKEVQNGYWELLQPGSSLPSQTGNAGKFLTTDGTDASWGNALTNKTTALGAVVISPENTGNVSVGNYGVCVGNDTKTVGDCGISIGFSAGRLNSNSKYAICIGYNNAATAIGAYQFGSGTNSEAGTVCFALNTDGNNANWHNYKVLDSDGTIPADRLASTTGLADGNYRLRLTIASGVPTLTWVAE